MMLLRKDCNKQTSNRRGGGGGGEKNPVEVTSPDKLRVDISNRMRKTEPAPLLLYHVCVSGLGEEAGFYMHLV